MRVMHVNWTGGALCLWGEQGAGAERASTVDTADAAAAEIGGEGSGDAVATLERTRTHSFSVDAADLLEVLQDIGVDVERTSKVELNLLLPSLVARPAPSPKLAHALGMPSSELLEIAGLETWTIPAIAIEPANATRVIEALEVTRKTAVGPSVAYFAAAARFARSLAVRQRFVPMLLQEADGELRAMWRPWLSDERTGTEASDLLAAMPPMVRAVVDHFDHQPWLILEDFLNHSVDALCRSVLIHEEMIDAIEGRSGHDDQHVAWLSGLLSSETRAVAKPSDRPTMMRLVRRWIGQLDDRGADVEWRLCLRLTEPPMDEDVDELSASAAEPDTTWRLTFHLQSVEQEQVILDAEDIWLATSDAHTVDGRRVQSPGELLLAELARASRLFDPLEAALDVAEPHGLDLNTKQAYTFLREARQLLQEQGFGVITPDWWEQSSARLGVRLEIDAPPAPEGGVGAQAPEREDGLLGLDSLVDYRWRIAVGDRTLSLKEFERLSTMGRPLVRIDGRWVEIRPEDVKAASSFISENPGGQMRVAEALRLAFGADERAEQAPIVGLDASGWVGAIFGGDDADSPMPMLEQPEGFMGTLRPYQLKGVSWLDFLDRFGMGACLADDMGLGKTIQLLALLLHERERAAKRAAETGEPPKKIGPTLLVAPTSVVGNWRREAARFAPSLKVIVHHGADRLDGEEMVRVYSETDMVVTTYALARLDCDRLSKTPWARLTLDEAQNIKNPASKQTRSLRSLDAPRRIALTGTPVENRLSELWSIMEFCNPGYLGPASQFQRRYAAPIERRHDRRRSSQLRSLVRPFVLRRLKSDPDVTADLPDKIETKEMCSLTPEQASLYEATVQRMLSQVDNAAEGMQRRGVVLAALIRLKQICNHPDNLPQQDGPRIEDQPHSAARSGKSTRLMEMLEEIVAAGDQALVFTQFRRMGAILAGMFAQAFDRETLFLHGGTPTKMREQMVDRFQRGDGSAPIFLLSLKAGGLGMNLTAANHVFHYDRWWNPAVENQATDRAHRIGQTRTVHVHKFMVAGTLEERIDQMIEQKTELAENIIASGERWLTELSTSQLRDLLTLRADAVMT
ncbi:MAG: DEAD/DEAH box helicase [Phycisphaeraceae bacterium]|nr:MAG: DEAD/DEAH box helicase [Phycisphaeraceae bacterium]